MERIKLTDELLAALEAEAHRTGIVWEDVFGPGSNLPDDLSAGMIRKWQKGLTKKARKDHYDAVLALLQSLQSTPVPGAIVKPHIHDPTRRIFMPEDLAALEHERTRTGVMQTALIELFANEVPEGLRASTITMWINDPPRTVNAEHLAWVLQKWRSLPDGDR